MKANPDATSDTRQYLQYLENHPDVLRNQPRVAMSRIVWRKKILTGRSTADQVNREMATIVQQWERYHLENAARLGLEIDIEAFKWRKGTPFTRLRKF